jgi:hypothetical protein
MFGAVDLYTLASLSSILLRSIFDSSSVIDWKPIGGVFLKATEETSKQDRRWTGYMGQKAAVKF